MKKLEKAECLLVLLLVTAACPNIPIDEGSALRAILYSASELDGTYDGFFIETEGEIEIFDDPTSIFPSTGGLYSFEFEKYVPDTASKINRCQIELPVNRARSEDVNDYHLRFSHVSYYIDGGTVELTLLSNPDSPDPALQDITQTIPGSNLNNGGTILFDATNWCRENFDLRREKMQILSEYDAFLIVGQSVEIFLQEGILFGDPNSGDTARRPRLIVDYQ